MQVLLYTGIGVVIVMVNGRRYSQRNVNTAAIARRCIYNRIPYRDMRS